MEATGRDLVESKAEEARDHAGDTDEGLVAVDDGGSGRVVIS